MKKRPIIFSAPMVRAILDGRKTQTRRVAKIARIDAHPQDARVKIATMAGRGAQFWMNCQPEHPQHISRACPYGVPGDRLWVREAWQAFFADEVQADRPRGPRHTMGIPAHPDRESFYFYRADGELLHPGDGSEALWRSPLHLPRWASRITLEIVSVRVERVQEISEEDAIAEGIYQEPEDSDSMFAGLWTKGPRSEEGNYHSSPRDAYFDLWDSINAKRASWESNPWVWAIEFRRIDA